VAISFYRKDHVRKEHTDILTDSILNLKGTEVPAESDQHLLLLQQFISELREMDKAVMLLYLEEKSHKEIAEIVGLSESNVGTKISRIKTNLTHKFSTFKNQF
jgi:RNA polymerase sigma-70 factor (ECF subfamily)